MGQQNPLENTQSENSSDTAKPGFAWAAILAACALFGIVGFVGSHMVRVESYTGPVTHAELERQEPAVTSVDAPRKSPGVGVKTEIWFENRLTKDVRIFWRSVDGTKVAFGTLAPHAKRGFRTHSGCVWEAQSMKGEVIATFVCLKKGSQAVIGAATSRPDSPATARKQLVGKTSDQLYAEGLRWFRGDGVTRDSRRAFACFDEAARKGHAEAKSMLGTLIYQGLGGAKKDPARAIALFRDSAKAGNARGQVNLALAYIAGNGIRKDYTRAAELMREAANQQNRSGEFYLGLMYQEGVGVKKDPAQAFAWMKKAATQGSTAAQVNLGNMYYLGQGVRKSLTNALRWYQRAADNGAAQGYGSLGRAYYYGEGVLRSLSRAFRNYEAAAKKGERNAQYMTAYMLEKGEGVPQDPKKARYWYGEAAKQKDSGAMLNLSLMYSRGVGGTADPQKARELLARSAALGNAKAKLQLRRSIGIDKAKSEAQAFVEGIVEKTAASVFEQAVSSWFSDPLHREWNDPNTPQAMQEKRDLMNLHRQNGYGRSHR